MQFYFGVDGNGSPWILILPLFRYFIPTDWEVLPLHQLVTYRITQGFIQDKGRILIIPIFCLIMRMFNFQWV